MVMKDTWSLRLAPGPHQTNASSTTLLILLLSEGWEETLWFVSNRLLCISRAAVEICRFASPLPFFASKQARALWLALPA